MSAPPTVAVKVKPLTKLNRALTPKYPAAMIGTVGAVIAKALSVAKFVPIKPIFVKCPPNNLIGLLDALPLSLANATKLPVNVIPPTMTPRYERTRCSVEACERSAKALPMQVKTAARPTTEWRAATV